jgi:hypothetical protein
LEFVEDLSDDADYAVANKAVGAKLLRKGRKWSGAWVPRQVINNGVYGVLLTGIPIISTLA